MPIAKAEGVDGDCEEVRVYLDDEHYIEITVSPNDCSVRLRSNGPELIAAAVARRQLAVYAKRPSGG